MDQYTVGELAEVAGVSRRTVRYYVQENLLPPPRGRGRGAHYGPEHLKQILRVKEMQERGLSLGEIQHALKSPEPPESVPFSSPVRPPRSLWTRLEIGSGVELHLAAGRRPPSPAALLELMEWCERAIPCGKESEE